MRLHHAPAARAARNCAAPSVGRQLPRRPLARAPATRAGPAPITPPPPCNAASHCSQATPEEVLEGVLQGADLFDCGYPTHATLNGYALCFSHRMPGAGAAGAGEGAEPAAAAGPEEGADDSKLNLWAVEYRWAGARGCARTVRCVGSGVLLAVRLARAIGLGEIVAAVQGHSCRHPASQMQYAGRLAVSSNPA